MVRNVPVLQGSISNTRQCPRCHGQLISRTPHPKPCLVLDPFGGSGTTAIAAEMMGRNAILCELNPEYVDIMAARRAETAPLLLGTGA